MVPFQVPWKPAKLPEVLLLKLLMPASLKVPLGSKGIWISLHLGILWPFSEWQKVG